MAKVFSSGWSSALAGGADTVVARATPAGRGGLAVIRVSGVTTRELAGKVCPALDMDRGWRAQLVTVIDPSGGEIDRAVAVPYPAPRSFTGEDMLELTVHGSAWVVRETLDAFRSEGARDAEPGEFTRRAVANGKLDLVQAEAVNELARAETAAMARMAQAQVSGELSARFAELRDELAGLSARIEAGLDFAAQEIPYDRVGAEDGRDRCRALIDPLLSTARAGRRLRDGVRAVITGPVNAGKSTLFNRLVGAERAIVSPHEGTTRDLLEAELEIGGGRVILQDTAGLGGAEHPVNAEGVRRARGAAAEAEVLLVLWPADRVDAPDVPVGEGQVAIRAWSKSDLADDAEPPDGWIPVSCFSGAGERLVREALAAAVVDEVEDLGGRVAISERHRVALEAAARVLSEADFEAPEIAAEAVRVALDNVRGLLGEVTAEDVLDRIFAEFCLGK